MKTRGAQEQISMSDFSDMRGLTAEASLPVDLSMDWNSLLAADAPAGKADSVSDALVLSLTTVGKVDIETIASLTGKDGKAIIGELRGAIYQNPETWGGNLYQGWETAEEYLSGNLMRKLRAAEQANRVYRGQFRDNIQAIQRVLPDAVGAKDIYVTLGSPWVPTDIIDEFITYMLQLRRPFHGTKHDELTGSWEIPSKSIYQYGIRSRDTYGTERITALYILEKTLNLKTLAVTDEIPCHTNVSGKKRVVNHDQTVLALEKQEKMIRAFRNWVWKDPVRQVRLEEIFENLYGCVRRRLFNGSFLKFPTMAPSVHLYPYQKDAVARILFTPNTLLAHDVGSGKTYVMIAAGMELLRMGLSKKNMYVVPNNIVGQWRTIFCEMYPNANLLCVEPKTFTPEKRRAVLESMRDGAFDAIIIAYSCFEAIPLSKQYYTEKLTKEYEQIKAQQKKIGKDTPQLNKKREALHKALTALGGVGDGKGGVFFDELGVTRLFVDEAHNYKNVPVDTKINCVLGISDTGSKKCRDMMDKVRTVQQQNNGKGVVFATGTPITNSITEVFVMQRYLQSGELAMLDLQNFDSWVGMFAERVTEFEIDVDTNGYRLATRFAKFHNLPELTALLSSIADFHRVDASAGIPETDGYTDTPIGKTPALHAYLQAISRRADDVRQGNVSRRDDNMLKITTDGRKAALDIRLVQEDAPFTVESKVARCVENALYAYHATAGTKSAQLIFCDSSTPKEGFKIYDEVKRLLVLAGVPEAEIAFVHDATTERKREALFKAVRKGEIRILLGSTFKLGLGVNVQDKLVALHHLDVPWRPADMTQREGRILRQGNENKKVKIFRYVTEGSFDAYSWQLLETKARFIADLLSGTYTARSGSDVQDTVLDYAEVKALAVGNPLVKMRVETANELSRYLMLQRQLVERRERMERALMELPAKKAALRARIQECGADLRYYGTLPPECDESTAGKKEVAERRRALRERLYAAVQQNELETEERTLMTYKGFEIVLPAFMTLDKPYVYLRRAGRYYVELGDKELGGLQRIDNFLNNLAEHAEKFKNGLTALVRDEAELRAALRKDESYVDQIERCKKRLAAIDKELGATE